MEDRGWVQNLATKCGGLSLSRVLRFLQPTYPVSKTLDGPPYGGGEANGARPQTTSGRPETE